MKPCHVLFACLFLAVPALAQDSARYSGEGITFDHPKDWTAKTKNQGGVPTITVGNDKGTQVLVQVHPGEADPKIVRGIMEQTFKKVFEGKLVAGSDKAAKRKLAGAEQEGVVMDFEVAKDAVIHLEVFAFPAPSKKKVMLTVFQNAAFDADAAKKGFDVIAGSLAEAGAGDKAPEQKPPAEETKAVPVTPPTKENVIAEDAHRGQAGVPNNKATIYKLTSKDLVPFSKTALYFKIALEENLDAGESGAIEVSTDFGGKWMKVDSWNTQRLNGARRAGNWHQINLAPLMEKAKVGDIDDVRVRFLYAGGSKGMTIEKVIWAKQ